MKYMDQINAYCPTNDAELREKQMILEYIRLFPDNILTRDNEMAHMTSSGFIMNAERSKVLFVHHNIYQTWTWTGGHADGDEDLLAIAMKEAMEETGLLGIQPLTEEMLSLDVIPVFPHYKRGKYICAHMHLNSSYVLIGDEGETTRVNENENSGVRWIPIEQISCYANEPDIVKIYERLIRKAKG